VELDAYRNIDEEEGVRDSGLEQTHRRAARYRKQATRSEDHGVGDEVRGPWSR
jgi:hypothetical protein